MSKELILTPFVVSGKDRKKKGKGKKRKATESVEEENDEGKETQLVSKQFVFKT